MPTFLPVAVDAAVRADQISTLLPRFNPSKEFKKVLDTIEFQKV